MSPPTPPPTKPLLAPQPRKKPINISFAFSKAASNRTKREAEEEKLAREAAIAAAAAAARGESEEGDDERRRMASDTASAASGGTGTRRSEVGEGDVDGLVLQEVDDVFREEDEYEDHEPAATGSVFGAPVEEEAKPQMTEE